MEKGAHLREEIWVQFPTCPFIVSNFICHLGFDRHSQKCRCCKPTPTFLCVSVKQAQKCRCRSVKLAGIMCQQLPKFAFTQGGCIPPTEEVLNAFEFAVP